MMDLETLGTSAGCTVLSVGAVHFNLGDTDTVEGIKADTDRWFYSRMEIITQQMQGLKIDAETLEWWFKQKPDAQCVFGETANNTTETLIKFGEFFKKNPAPYRSIWGNGSSFDCSIWDELHKMMFVKPPYQFWMHRDLRTLKNLAEIKSGIKFEKRIFEGVAHNALDDTINQVLDAQRYWATLKG